MSVDEFKCWFELYCVKHGLAPWCRLDGEFTVADLLSKMLEATVAERETIKKQMTQVDRAKQDPFPLLQIYATHMKEGR